MLNGFQLLHSMTKLSLCEDLNSNLYIFRYVSDLENLSQLTVKNNQIFINKKATKRIHIFPPVCNKATSTIYIDRKLTRIFISSYNSSTINHFRMPSC